MSARRKKIEFMIFLQWMATPPSERNPQTMKELGETIGVHPDTLTDWKEDVLANPQELNKLLSKVKAWGVDKLIVVIQRLFLKASGKDATAPMIELFLKFMVDWAPKVEKLIKGEITIEQYLEDLEKEEERKARSLRKKSQPKKRKKGNGRSLYSD